MRFLFSLFVLALPGGPASAGDGAVSAWRQVTVAATIVGWGKEPPGSGIFMFYRRVAIAEYGVIPRDLWMVWLGGTDSLPPVGAQCRVTYHIAGLNGSTVEPVEPQRDHAILDAFDCSPTALRYDGLVPNQSGHGQKE